MLLRRLRMYVAVFVVGTFLVLSMYFVPTALIGRMLRVNLSATTIVYVDGTSYPAGSTRMAGALNGMFNQPDYQQLFLNDKSQYPGTIGPLTGFGQPGLDVSVGMAVTALDPLIKNAQVQDPGGTIVVVGYSQGSAVATHEDAKLIAEGTNTQGLSFVLIGDPNRPNGGILTRIPSWIYIPLFGIRGGFPTTGNGAPVIMVSKQYDGVADAPVYGLNVVADLNALLGYMYLHSGNYSDVDLNTPKLDVTTSADGNLTDIVIPTPTLPLLRPLLTLGVPSVYVADLDPFFRAVIETGYDRGGDPSIVQPFQLLPPAAKWQADIESVVAGAQKTGQLLQETFLSGVLPSSGTTGGDIKGRAAATQALPTKVSHSGMPVKKATFKPHVGTLRPKTDHSSPTARHTASSHSKSGTSSRH